jgi:hypothetical protein
LAGIGGRRLKHTQFLDYQVVNSNIEADRDDAIISFAS